MYILFEGIDGVGKSTQISRLAAKFNAGLGGDEACKNAQNADESGNYKEAHRCDNQNGKAHPVAIVTREPGGSEFGEYLREILLGGKFKLSSRAEALLFLADRAEHYAKVVAPNLCGLDRDLSGQNLKAQKSDYDERNLSEQKELASSDPSEQNLKTQDLIKQNLSEQKSGVSNNQDGRNLNENSQNLRRIVLSDRGFISGVAYAMANDENADMSELIALNKFALGGNLPDKIILFIASKDLVKERIKTRGTSDAIEARGLEYLMRVQSFMREACEACGVPTLIIDASWQIETISEQIENFIKFKG